MKKSTRIPMPVLVDMPIPDDGWKGRAQEVRKLAEGLRKDRDELYHEVSKLRSAILLERVVHILRETRCACQICTMAEVIQKKGKYAPSEDKHDG